MTHCEHCFRAGVKAAIQELREYCCDDSECHGCTLCNHSTEWADDIERRLITGRAPYEGPPAHHAQSAPPPMNKPVLNRITGLREVWNETMNRWEPPAPEADLCPECGSRWVTINIPGSSVKQAHICGGRADTASAPPVTRKCVECGMIVIEDGHRDDCSSRPPERGCTTCAHGEVDEKDYPCNECFTRPINESPKWEPRKPPCGDCQPANPDVGIGEYLCPRHATKENT